MAIDIVTVRGGFRDRSGKPLPSGSKLTLEDVAGWSALPSEVESGALRLEVDGEPLDRHLAAAALRARSKPGPVKVGELPRAGQPHWLDKAKDEPKPETAQEARSMAAGLAGPILDHGDDIAADAHLTKEERAKVMARFEPQLDHANDDHSLGTDDDKMKKDADKNKTRPGAKAKGDGRSEGKIAQDSQAAGLAGPILDHAKDPGTLDEREKASGLKPNTPTGDRWNPKTGKMEKASKAEDVPERRPLPRASDHTLEGRGLDEENGDRSDPAFKKSPPPKNKG